MSSRGSSFLRLLLSSSRSKRWLIPSVLLLPSDTDPRVLEKQEQQQPTYLALSYINRYAPSVTRGKVCIQRGQHCSTVIKLHSCVHSCDLGDLRWVMSSQSSDSSRKRAFQTARDNRSWLPPGAAFQAACVGVSFFCFVWSGEPKLSHHT